MNLSIGSNLDKNQSRLFSHDSAYNTKQKFVQKFHLEERENSSCFTVDFQGSRKLKAKSSDLTDEVFIDFVFNMMIHEHYFPLH